MILVTGAAGKTGQAVLRALESKGVPVRALVRREEQVAAIQALSANDVAIGDLTSAEALGRTLDGVQTIYLIVPNMHPEEARIGEIAIQAARESGTERIVYHSVLHPQTREMPHHWQKLAVEEQLFASGLDFTILQPAAYMQNLLPYWNEIIGEGVYRVHLDFSVSHMNLVTLRCE